MATSSQRKQNRAQREKRKRRKARIEKKENIAPSVAGTRERLNRQKPLEWPGELPEDVAVFDDSTLEALPKEVAEAVTAVRQALDDACNGQGEEATQRVAHIPRSSPLSQWRLFLRGLVAWTDINMSSASEAWMRLDPDRRPGRIAVAMMCAHQDDLDVSGRTSAASHSVAVESSPPTAVDWTQRLDPDLRYHAKLLRRVAIERSFLRMASLGANAPEEEDELQCGPKKMKWLKEFCGEIDSMEPELAATLQQVALARVFEQGYIDLFDQATSQFEGPAHDRQNSLLKYFFYSEAKGAANGAIAEKSLQTYLTKDLPVNESLSQPLRSAIASTIYLRKAMENTISSLVRLGPFSFGRTSDKDSKSAETDFAKSVRAYPANTSAHVARTKWLETRIRLSGNKKDTKPLEGKLAVAMQEWSQSLPDDPKPRLWLVDHYFENEDMASAEPHVAWMTTSRHADPRVRAIRWKWALLEAMRLCRRKTWLAQVPIQLDAAAAAWPTWLSAEWLPYLRAAYELRRGDVEAFQQNRQQAREQAMLPEDSLADHCLMLAAAQKMRVPPAELKPLRAPIDRALAHPKDIRWTLLIRTCSFFWDLQRINLLYPANRLHGSRIARELISRLEGNRKLFQEHCESLPFRAALLACSEYGVWGDDEFLQTPRWAPEVELEDCPHLAAAMANGFLDKKRPWGTERGAKVVATLRDASKTERDPYYQYWFEKLADETEASLREMCSPFGLDSFNAADFGFDEWADDYEEEEEGDNHAECNCPKCRAARRGS